jgi:hypothetical protein
MKLEKEDFYLENGMKVFTEAYHLKRGFCCGNKCRHCPFEHKNVKSELSERHIAQIIRRKMIQKVKPSGKIYTRKKD